MSGSTAPDPELETVAQEIRRLDPNGSRTAQVLRDTIDQLYDGQRTGRYRWDQLFKTEKTHCGTLVEINLHREFKFQNGTMLDYRIAGAEVDCKYSQTVGGWMIPPEARGHLCLLLSAEDAPNPRWSMGLVRILDERLNVGSNRDAKSTLNSQGRTSIVWLFKDAPLPPNVLLQLDRATVDGIMSLSSGQKRINELFRVAQRKKIGRAVIATVAQQDDYMKRVRANGGARTTLQREGILILGQYGSHVAVAKALGIVTPGAGESVSVRVIPTSGPEVGVAEINGEFWRVANENDPLVDAPSLPGV
jgi:hypothetical protein